jgi:hypothetical protein
MLQQNLSQLAFRQFSRILISSFIELRSNRPLQLFIESGVQCVEKPAVAESEVLEPIVGAGTLLGMANGKVYIRVDGVIYAFPINDAPAVLGLEFLPG